MKQTTPSPSTQEVSNLPLDPFLVLRGEGVVIGCDPGPEFSAFALASVKGNQIRCEWARYIYNGDIMMSSPEQFMKLFPRKAAAFVYEKTVNHGRIVGSLVFNTCAASGMIRYLARSSGLAQNLIAAVSPSMWRYSTVGFGSAKDSETREALEDVLHVADVKSIINEENKRAKKEYRLAKPCTSHLRDAVGVAVAALYSTVRFGADGLSSMTEPVWVNEECIGGRNEKS